MRRAKNIIPGGVNSPVRAFGAVQATPIFIREAHGSRIIDVDGREYVDYVMSWGPMILGHSHPVVTEAIRQAAGRGTSYGAPTELEVEMAEIIIDAIPSMQMVRMVSSGTEAVMSAIRLARGYTGKNKIIKFDGLLSRPCRFAACQGRLRRRDAGHSGKPRHPGGAGRIDDHAALQRY